MSCKDCLHFIVCERANFIFDDIEKQVQCKYYKSKANFVEVVRCEKCLYGDVSIHSKAKDGQEVVACYCTIKNKVTDVDYYCPSGKRTINQ